MSNKPKIENIFAKEPPLTGGTFYASKHNMKAREELINVKLLNSKISDSVKSKLQTSDYTYPLYFLMQQQADYFTSLVRFRFNDKHLTENIYKVIRCGVIYGKSALWHTMRGIVPLYIADVKYDGYTGRPYYMKAALVDNVFSQKALEPNINNWLEFDELEFNNIYIFNSSSTGFGGLIRWLPFLKQFENLLKMLYTHSYSYLKFITYDVKDPNYVNAEMELFFSNESPFLINLGDDTLLRNKFKEFNFTSADKNAIFDYLNNFLNVYYSLIGRRYNVDVKRERNVSSEVTASQDNFDTLQNELKTYIYMMLDWIKNKTGYEWKQWETKEGSFVYEVQ